MQLVPVVSIVPSFPPPRYEIYRKTKEPTWLDALHTWKDKTNSRVTWSEEFRREEHNQATHIMTPVLTCTIYERPSEDVQMHLRRAASSPMEALEATKNAVQSRIGGKALLGFYARVGDNDKEKSHCRYKVVDISYTYRLENRIVTEYRSEGNTKNDARQKAARNLLESRAYCMFIRN